MPPEDTGTKQETMTESEIEKLLDSEVGDTDADTGDTKKGEADSGEKGSEGEKGGKKEAEAEPEIELDGEKIKVSDVKKWKQSSLLEEDYSKKLGNLSEREKQIAHLEQLSAELSKSPSKLKKVLDILDEKDTTGEEKQDEIAQLLQGLSDDDPFAKSLKAILTKLSGLEKIVSKFEQADQKYSQEQQVQEAQKTLNGTLEKLQTALKWSSDEEKELWRWMTLNHLLKEERDFEGMEEYADAVKKIGLHYHKVVTKVGEAALKQYLLKRNGAGPTPPGPGGSGGGSKETPKKVSFDNLQEGIQGALEELLSQKTD